MSMEVANATKSLGQFASNSGYSALVEAAQDDAVLTKFFREGITEDVPAVVAALRTLVGEPDVVKTARDLADLIEGEKVAVITDGLVQEKGEVEPVGKQRSHSDALTLVVEGETEEFPLRGGEILKAEASAPNYREAADARTCKTCVHGGDRYCDLYKFNTKTGFVCNSYEPLSPAFEKYVPPQEVQANARKALERYRTAEEKLDDEVVLLLLSAIANGRPLSREEIQFMADYLTDHYEVMDEESWTSQGAEWQAWNALGGRAGLSWAKRVLSIESNSVNNSLTSCF